MSESNSEPQDATAALQELEKQLAGGKAEDPVSAAVAVAAAAATSKAPARVEKAAGSAKSAPAARGKNKSRRVFFEGGPSRTIAAIKKRFHELVDSLESSDVPTRRGGRIFWGAIAGIFLVIGVTGHRYWGHIHDLRMRAARMARQQNAILAEFLKKRSDMARRRNATLVLGGFNIALQAEPGSRGPSSSYRLAEMEIVIECDSKESRVFLEENIDRARNEVTNTFVNVDRQLLMTPEGKNRLKHALLDRLNLLLPKGRVESVFFSKLVLT
jgi:hypothetical protein